MTDLQNILTNPLMQRAGWALLHFFWQGAAVAALLVVAMLLLRRRSPNLRYAIACSALMLMLAMPAATMWLVKPVGRLGRSEAEAHLLPSRTEKVGLAPLDPAYSSEIDRLGRSEAEGHLPYIDKRQKQGGPPLRSDPAYTAEPAELVEPPQPWRERAGETVRPALPWVVLGWLIGVLVLSAWHVRGWIQVQRLRRVGVRPVGREITDVLARLCKRLGIGRAVRVVESALVRVPTVVGCLKPIILLPASALTGLTAEQLEAILAHELAHIRRHDYLINLLQTAAETLLFYHPAAWWVSARIRAERENCCDDLAIAASGQPLVYARALTTVAKLSQPQPRLAVAADGGGKFLARIRRIVGQPTNDASRRGRWLAGAFTLLTVLAIVITLGVSCVTDKPPTARDNDESATTQKRSVGESLQRDLTDNFEDGAIDTTVWVTGGAKRGSFKRTPKGVGHWTFSCKEIRGEDGHLQLRVAGPRSGNTYGAEAWARTKRDFNDGRTWMINFCWQADVAIKGHYDYYHIQITDGSIPDIGYIHWSLNDNPGTVDFLTSYDSRGKSRNGKPLMQGTPKRHWSIRIDPKGTAVLYDGPSGTGKIVSRGKLDSKKPWHIRFMVLDATSAGFPGGDTRFKLYRFTSSVGRATSPSRYTFQQGVDGYTGTADTSLIHCEPDTSYGSDTFVEADGSTVGDTIHDEGLVRFDNIFGSGGIPYRAKIVSATLTLQMMQPGAAGSKVYRMCRPWTEDDTWNDWGGGILPDGIEAKKTPEVTLGQIRTGTLDIDVTSSLQAWSSGITDNNGWVFINGPNQSDGYQFRSSEYSIRSKRPKLTVIVLEASCAADKTRAYTTRHATKPAGNLSPADKTGAAKKELLAEVVALARAAIALPTRDVGPIKSRQNPTGLDLSPILKFSGQKKDFDDFTKDHRFFERDVEKLVRRKKTWALCALLDHPNVGAKIRAARGLVKLADPSSAAVLLAAAKSNNYPVEGSEEASLHSNYRRTLKQGLEKITGLSLTPKGLKVITYLKPGQGKVIRSEDDPSRFKEYVDFKKVENWLRQTFLPAPTTKSGNKAEGTTWSQTVNGLQARITLKRSAVSNGTPIISTYLELRNVSNLAAPMRLAWASEKMKFRVIDANGRELPAAMGKGNWRSLGKQNLVIPNRGTLSFDISSRGLGIPGDQAGLIDLGSTYNWVFKHKEKDYYLRAVLKIPEDKHDRDRRSWWHGQIEMPPVRVPLKPEPVDPAKLGERIRKLGGKMLATDFAASEKAVRALSLIDDERVIPWYLKAMDTNRYGLKFAALDRLSRFNSDEALRGLKKGMTTRGADIGNCTTDAVADQMADNIRHTAAAALARSPHPEARNLLLSMRNDPSSAVRITVLHALGRMDSAESLMLLKKMSKDHDEGVRKEALRYLKLRESPPATQPAWGKVVKGLRVSIRAEKKRFAKGQPVLVHWKIENVGKVDRTIIWHKLHYSPVLFDIAHKGGKKYLNCFDSRRLFIGAVPSPPEKIVLRPGRSKEATFDLRYFMGMGTTLTGVLKVTGLYAPKAPQAQAAYFIGQPKYKDAVSDRIASNEIEIVITETATKPGAGSDSKPPVAVHSSDAVLESLNLTVRKDIQELIDAVALPGKGPVNLPAPTIAVRAGVATEVFGAWGSYKNLGSGKTNADFSRAVQELIRVKAVWCISTGLCHRNKDVQIRCARALGDLKGIRPARFLLTVAHANAVYVEGSESASLHGILQHALTKALNRILGTSVHLKEGQDPEGLEAGIKVWSAALANKEKTDYAPLVKVLQDWPAKGVYDIRQSPFFQALAILARRQKLNNKDYLPCGFVPAANGRVKVFRSGNEEILVAIIGNTPMTHPGTSAQQIILLDKAGRILDSLGCRINSRYGLISTVFKDKPDPDGARMVITFPPNRWHNWHRIIYRGKTYTFREDERNQPPEWDRKGLCRIGIKNRRLVVLFPTLWPRPGGSKLEFRLVAFKPGSKRGPVLENVERRIKELTTRGPKAANNLVDGFRWFEIQCEAPSLSVVAKYGRREYILLSNVQRQIMLSHSTDPKGKAWGLKRVYLSKDARGRPAVAFVLDAAGARLFQTFAETYKNRVLAILVDGKVLSTRIVRTEGSKQGVIEGNFTDQQARNLVEAIKVGMMNDPKSLGARDLNPATQPGGIKSSKQAKIPLDVGKQIERLFSSNPKTRAVAAMELGQMGDRAAPAIPHLIALLGDKTKFDTRDVYRKTPLIPTFFRVGGWSFGGYVAADATDALAKIGKAAVKPLIAALKDKNAFARMHAARALGGIKDKESVEALCEVLKDEDPGVRSAGAIALGEIRDPRAGKPLAGLLSDKVYRPRKDAIEALVKLGKSGTGPLLEAMRHPSTAQCAARVLAKTKDAQALDPLVTALKDADPLVRRGAAIGLGALGDRRAVKPLTELLLEDPDPYVRADAAQALCSIGGVRLEVWKAALTDSESQVRIYAVRALGKVGATEALIGALKDKSSSVRHQAISMLSTGGDRDAVPPLIAMLGDKRENKSIRGNVAGALGWLHDRRAVKPLISALKDEHAIVRSNATWALGRMKDPQAVDPLCRVLSDKKPDIRVRAAIALRDIRDKRAVAALVKALRDPDWEVALRAADALGRIGDPKAVEPLISALKDELKNPRKVRIVREPYRDTTDDLIWMGEGDDTAVAIAMVQALGAIGDKRATAPLLTALKDKRWRIRWAVTLGLGRIKDGAAVMPLIAAMKDEHSSVIISAVESLGLMKDPRAIEPLIAALKDDRQDIRSKAATALYLITGPNPNQTWEEWQKWWKENRHKWPKPATQPATKPSP